jgi:UDP-N-acetylmuramoylalanine--D-glutamate ligase
MTNLSPDHLDRYASVGEYYGDKALLFANASDQSHWVLNAGDPTVVEMSLHARGAHHYFSRERAPLAEMAFVGPGDIATGVDTNAGCAGRGGSIWWNGQRLLCRDELHLLGGHNVENAMAAALAVIVASEQHETPAALERIANGLRSFRALEHRLEVVGEYDGVLWINDSKATNMSSALVAMQGMTRPTVLLLGGRHKGEPYTALAEPLARTGRAVIAYGEAAPIIEQDLSGVLPVERLGGDFNRVMARAHALARPGDVVLLSPACSSYDMFTNYEERGAEFKRLAREGR